MFSIGKFLTTSLLLLIFLISAAGLGIYSSYTILRGPKWIRNQFIGVWLTTSLLFYTLQSLYLSNKKSQRFLKYSFYVDLVYYAFTLVFTSITTLFYVLINRVDSVIFGSLITFINLINFLIIINRRIQVKTEEKYTDYIDSIKSCKFINFNESIYKSAFRLINLIIKIIFLINLILLSNGSLLNGVVSIRYGPKGKFVNVPLADRSNRWINIHYLCDGPKSSNYTFMLESDFTSTYLELLEVQKQLVKLNRRACVWDKAGLGYSDFLYSDMYNYDLYYTNFIKTLNESRVVLVGFGDAASLILENVGKLTETIEGVILVEGFQTRLKWNAEAQARNWTTQRLKWQIDKYVEKKLSNNKLINAIGVPFGLVSLILKTKNFDFSKEKNLFLLNEKIWLSEKSYLEQLRFEFDDLFKINYAANSFNLSISHLISSRSNEQVFKQVCVPRKVDSNSKYCLYEKQINRYLISERKKMVKNGHVYECDLDECNLDYLMHKKPEYTAKALIELCP